MDKRLTFFHWFTVERALYGLCLATAAALRFHNLGGNPLGPGEAATVWPAWVTATTGEGPGRPAFASPTSALLFSLHWFLFWLTGAANDALTRWPPAAIGTSVVLLPWLLRAVLGPTPALMLAAFLAIDPLLVNLSRTADGASLSAFCGLLALITVARLGQGGYAHTGSEPRRHIAAVLPAIALGLLLVSGTQAWSFLILLAVVVAVSRRTDGSHGWAPILRGSGVRLTGIVLVTAALAATTGFAQWEGPRLVSISLTAWLHAWQSNVGYGAALADLATGLVRAQPLLLVLPIVGLASVWNRDGTPPGRLLPPTLVLLTATALAVGQASKLASRLPLVMVLAFVAAHAGGSLVTRVAALLRRETAGSAVVGWGLVLTVAFMALATLRVGAIGQLTRGPLVSFPDVNPDGIRLLSRDVAAICPGRGGATAACRIDIVARPWPDPLLGWYLRDIGPARWVLSPAGGHDETARRLIVIPADADDPERDGAVMSLSAEYVGSEYRTGGPALTGGRVVLWVPRE